MENELLKKLEKIEKALIDFNPFFKDIFCEHRFEHSKYLQDFEGKTTSGLIDKPQYICKKCGKILEK